MNLLAYFASLAVLAIGINAESDLVKMLMQKDCESSLVTDKYSVSGECTKTCNFPNTVCAIDKSQAFQGNNDVLGNKHQICVSPSRACIQALSGASSGGSSSSGSTSSGSTSSGTQTSGSTSGGSTSSGTRTSGSTSTGGSPGSRFSSFLSRFGVNSQTNTNTASSSTQDSRCTAEPPENRTSRMCLFELPRYRNSQKYAYKNGSCSEHTSFCGPKPGRNLFLSLSACNQACGN